ncbi:E3 ubiquitin-protein ligase rnf12-like protein [Trifolium pratense]|uniref:E3 ubiquitin-protein ligase rnf12-like protein n=1 Tax=Trifolium pratense TaxID=57577 RepID=A0A2K3P0K6_TRIPR|nr:E3 ubiquitin-protein ligase rnf12-like protein [Trifolium pratense]
MMNQVVRGLNTRGSTMMQRSTMVDDVLILDSFVGNNMMSSSRSSTRRVAVNHPLMVNDRVPVSNVIPPWSMLDHTIVFDSNSIDNMGHHHHHQNPNVTQVNRVNHQKFQQLFTAIDDELTTTTTTGSSADSDSTCCICLTELCAGSSTAIRMPKHCCSHLFHRDCIREWLNVKSTCPLCRRNV